MSTQRYIGTISSVETADGYQFIGLETVTKDDGSPHGLETIEHIMLNSRNCDIETSVGLRIFFEVVRDADRSDSSYCAIHATKFVEGEVRQTLPAVATRIAAQINEPILGFALTVPPVREKQEFAVRERLPIHRSMKIVPDDVVAQVIANRPMPRIPRDNDIPQDDETKQRMVKWFLSILFPHMASFGTNYDILNYTDVELDREVKETIDNYVGMGLNQEIDVMRAEVKRFKAVRGALALMLQENLIRRDTMIPIQYLPDLFMAAPVWYFCADSTRQREAEVQWNSTDPSPHDTIRHFCNLFPNQRWFDTFQLFNRRLRVLNQYKGEVIPPAVTRRMRKAVEFFDYVVIATPYHDQSGMEWDVGNWQRGVDPYVLGFKKDIPFIFVIARFSETGTFPLFNELIGDTLEFLRTEKGKLTRFNHTRTPNWYHANKQTSFGNYPFADYLTEHATRLMAAFYEGNLFDWLRCEEGTIQNKNTSPPTRTHSHD